MNLKVLTRKLSKLTKKEVVHLIWATNLDERLVADFKKMNDIQHFGDCFECRKIADKLK